MFRNSRSVAQFVYEEEVSGHQAGFHRRRGNLERLEEEDVDEGYEDDGEDDGVEPFVPAAALLPFLVTLLPEVPVYLLGDEDVEDYRKAEKPPVIPQPDYP